MDALISVIVPVYNVEQYIVKCIESIISQTYRFLEIILVDDGSCDHSGRICDRYAQLDSRIKVIHQKNAGVSAARNLGISISTGDYLMFVDGDDYISQDAVEYLFRRLIKDKSDYTVGQMVEVHGDELYHNHRYAWMTNSVMSKERALATFGTKKEVPMYVWGKLYSRKIFDGVQFPPITCCEDAWVILEVTDKSSQISLSDHVIYYYVQRESSVLHSPNEKRSYDAFLAALHIAEGLYERGYIKNAKSFFNSAICRTTRMKDTQKAKKLINDTFPPSVRRKLMYRTPEMALRWGALNCMPLRVVTLRVYDLLKFIIKK